MNQAPPAWDITAPATKSWGTVRRFGRVRPEQERSFVTPEGVDLRLQIATSGDRIAAFLLDVAIIAATVVLIATILVFAGISTESAEPVLVLWLLGIFVLRNFYFTIFELGRRAATPGKRALGIRVAPRDGGYLRPDQIFSRNVMREIEIFLPLSVALSGSSASSSGLIFLAAFIWTGIFALFPLFNRDRLRCGDLIAGTWVVKAPKPVLQRDVSLKDERAVSTYRFTREELDAYGVHELHVLEDILRIGRPDTIKAVAERIRNKIGRDMSPDENDARFLDAYYTALRNRLETMLLMGVRREDKHDGASTK